MTPDTCRLVSTDKMVKLAGEMETRVGMIRCQLPHYVTQAQRRSSDAGDALDSLRRFLDHIGNTSEDLEHWVRRDMGGPSSTSQLKGNDRREQRLRNIYGAFVPTRDRDWHAVTQAITEAEPDMRQFDMLLTQIEGVLSWIKVKIQPLNPETHHAGTRRLEPTAAPEAPVAQCDAEIAAKAEDDEMAISVTLAIDPEATDVYGSFRGVRKEHDQGWKDCGKVEGESWVQGSSEWEANRGNWSYEYERKKERWETDPDDWHNPMSPEEQKRFEAGDTSAALGSTAQKDVVATDRDDTSSGGDDIPEDDEYPSDEDDLYTTKLGYGKQKSMSIFYSVSLLPSSGARIPIIPPKFC